MYCSACGTQNDANNYRCIQCGQILQQQQQQQQFAQQPQQQQYPAPMPQQQNYALARKSKILAGVLQIFLPFGVGRFYLGYSGMGVAQLLLTFFCGIGAFWCIVDGILILTGSVSHDANGMPLGD